MFICWLWPQSAYQYSVFTFNFEQIYVSTMWKASHNVLKTQKAHICFVIKVARSISFSELSLHQIEINYEQITTLWTYYEHGINICFISKFALGILRVLSTFCPVSWSALSSLFPKDLIFFWCIKTKTYLNHWNSETNWLVFHLLSW